MSTGNFSQDLFFNGVPLRRVLTRADVIAGCSEPIDNCTWHLDYAEGVATIGLADTSGGVLELSWVQVVIAGNCLGGNGVCGGMSVEGLVAEHHGNAAQTNVFEGADEVVDCEVRYNHGTGLGSRVQTNNYGTAEHTHSPVVSRFTLPIKLIVLPPSSSRFYFIAQFITMGRWAPEGAAVPSSQATRLPTTTLLGTTKGGSAAEPSAWCQTLRF